MLIYYDMDTTNADIGFKVLIVEDDFANRMMMSMTLKEKGYVIIEAASGMEGIRLAHKEIPAVILMDIGMPVMDGVDTLKALRRSPQTRGIKVIAQTAFAMKGDRERLLSEGFDDYIPKPFSPDHLESVIRKHQDKEFVTDTLNYMSEE